VRGPGLPLLGEFAGGVDAAEVLAALDLDDDGGARRRRRFTRPGEERAPIPLGG